MVDYTIMRLRDWLVHGKFVLVEGGLPIAYSVYNAAGILLSAGSEHEVEIRACSIWAVEVSICRLGH